AVTHGCRVPPRHAGGPVSRARLRLPARPRRDAHRFRTPAPEPAASDRQGTQGENAMTTRRITMRTNTTSVTSVLMVALWCMPAAAFVHAGGWGRAGGDRNAWAAQGFRRGHAS